LLSHDLDHADREAHHWIGREFAWLEAVGVDL
jgi:hypothetical protein